mgnify:CR=1 FL=1
MSVLTKQEIIKEIKKGNIKIEPFNIENIGPGSIDLTLGDKFRTFKKSEKIYDVSDEVDYKEITRLVKADSIVINPQETVLGVTKEKITLAPDISGRLEGRSRFARIGLLVHISASFMQPGISNHQVLEISNMGRIPLRLYAGTKVCQFIFERTEGEAKYKGKFRDQDEP